MATKKITTGTKGLLPAATSRRISKLTSSDNVRSIVGDSRHEIQELLENSDNDSASSLMKRRMLQMLADLLPFAESQVRKTKGQKGVYQVNSLITSIRELMIDMKSDQDRGALGSHMIEQVVRPAFLDVGMAVVLEEEKFLKAMRAELEPDAYKIVKAAHSETLRAVSMKVQEEYRDAKEKAIAFMQR